MNILLVTPAFFGRDINGTGMPMAIYRIAIGLRNEGHNPVIVTGGIQDKYEIFHGIPLWRVCTDRRHFFSPKGIMGIVERCVFENFILQRKVNSLVKKLNIDIIQYAGNNGTGMFHSSRIIKIPAIMRISSYFKQTFSTSMVYTPTEIRLHSYFERLAMKKMSGIYCPSNVMATYLSNLLKRKVAVIEPPFFIEEEHEDISYFKSKMKDRKYILYFGSVSPQKGVLLLAKIANKILQQYKEIYIVIIGNDCNVNGVSTKSIFKQKIDKEFSNRVLIFPAMDHRRLYPFIKGAEMILQPSYMENLSNACMEAMAFGKIVIGTKGASYEQLITDGENGYLMKIGSASELYSCICKVMNMSDAEKNEMGDLARKRMDKMKMEISIKRLLRFYESVCKNHAK